MRRALLVLLGGAFLIRLLPGLLRGPGFVESGYSFYAALARTWWHGGGLCYERFVDCTIRMPVYPIVAAPFLAAEAAYPWLIVFQALLDAATVWVSFGIASQLFNARVGIVAAIGVALNPYAAWHATSFQDTVVFNALIALAIYLLITAWRTGSSWRYAGGGLVLALAALTTVRMLLFLPLAAIWTVMSGSDVTIASRVKRGVLVTVPMVLLLAAWAFRNDRLIGTPLLSTESGLSLWMATHPIAMTVLPSQTIDLVEERALATLSEEERQTIASMARDPATQDRYFAQLAWTQIAANPVSTLTDGVKKAWYGWVAWLSPARDWPMQLAYGLVYLPLSVLALVGLWRARPFTGPHALIILLFASFVATTAVFWAHTSHRSFLHLFEIVYGASVIVRVATLTAAPSAAASRYSAS